MEQEPPIPQACQALKLELIQIPCKIILYSYGIISKIINDINPIPHYDATKKNNIEQSFTQQWLYTNTYALFQDKKRN